MFAFLRNFLSPEICFRKFAYLVGKLSAPPQGCKDLKYFQTSPLWAGRQFAISKNSSTISQRAMTKIFQARSPQRRKMPESETKLKLNIQFQPLADTTPKIRSLQNVKVFEIPPAPPTPFGTSSFTYPNLCPCAAAKCKQISNMQRMLGEEREVKLKLNRELCE